MNKRELLAEIIDGRLHVAVLRGGRTVDLYTDPVDRSAGWASIYLAKVTRIDPKLDAAFVDLGDGLGGFLSAKHVHKTGADESETRSGIADLLEAGQMILVQIKSEAFPSSQHEHQKLPRVTMRLHVPGQSLVYSPTSSHVSISKSINRDDTLAITTKLQGQAGWIVQHSAVHATEDILTFEADNLMAAWHVIDSAAKQDPDTPRLLSQGPNALERAMLDYSSYAFDRIEVASRPLLDFMQAWSARFLPSLADSKKLVLFRPDKSSQSLFDLRDVSTTLDEAKEPTVHLPCGGTLIIERTHAFTVIDVNRGNAENISVVNTEAAQEIARQILLRNLSGAILVDFINMHYKPDRARLLGDLTRTIENDFSRAHVHGFTRLGIIEITRKRRTASLPETLQI